MKAMNAAIGALALALALGACTTAVRSGQSEGQALPKDPMSVDPRVQAKCDAESRRAWNLSSPAAIPPLSGAWSIERDIQRGLYRTCLIEPR